ncbi:MAG: transglutaminase family protein [Janthinobacterium lividum]
MHLTIRHDTHYRYQTPVQYSIQQLRLTPSTSPSQLVRRWHVDAPGKLDATQDAYGNVLHTLVLTRAHEEIFFSVSGEIDTTPLHDGRLSEGPGLIPIEHYTTLTPLTEVDDAIHDLAFAAPAPTSPAGLIALAERIESRVHYLPGATRVTSSAADALALGNGVCQDHAHLMLACCRARGVPARYVSGYIDPGDVPHAASHAWVDVWLGDLGWVSVDVTHTRFASEKYCRLAVARDYQAASPVRGTRVGGKEETLDVMVFVNVEALQ